MAWYNFLFSETRSIENPSVPLSTFDGDLFGSFKSTVGVTVNEAKALGVPAVWQAVNLIGGTLAHLPLHLFRQDASGEKVRATSDPLYRILHDKPNDAQTKFALFKWIGSRLLLDGRAIVLIVRSKANKVIGLLPLSNTKVQIKQTVVDDRLIRSYIYNNEIVYAARDVLDFVLLPQGDGCSHYSPIAVNRDAIGSIIAAESYASALFEGGGVPPLQLTGAFSSPASQDKAQEQIAAAVKSAKNRNRNVLAIPTGFELKAIGIDPAKQQLLELRQFQVAEVSRIFNVPPAMLFDLTHGTFSNVEQQNIAFTQHTMTPIVELIEQEMNAKLFGDRNISNSVEFALDGLMRGDFKTRMEGMARAVQTGMLTPNEARALENRPAKEGGDELYVQGAIVPITAAGKVPIAEPIDDEPSDDGEPVEDDDGSINKS